MQRITAPSKAKFRDCPSSFRNSIRKLDAEAQEPFAVGILKADEIPNGDKLSAALTGNPNDIFGGNNIPLEQVTGNLGLQNNIVGADGPGKVGLLRPGRFFQQSNSFLNRDPIRPSFSPDPFEIVFLNCLQWNKRLLVNLCHFTGTRRGQDREPGYENYGDCPGNRFHQYISVHIQPETCGSRMECPFSLAERFNRNGAAVFAHI